MLAPNTTYNIVMGAPNSEGKLKNSSTVTLKTNPLGSPSKAMLGQENIRVKSASEVTLILPSVEDTLDKGSQVIRSQYALKRVVNDQNFHECFFKD
eukprot:m.186938 g.186938  ORF g.186938 m.186938 type:complete len:96 (+) comp39357_c1_seq19:1490-1777(+)